MLSRIKKGVTAASVIPEFLSYRGYSSPKMTLESDVSALPILTNLLNSVAQRGPQKTVVQTAKTAAFVTWNAS